MRQDPCNTDNLCHLILPPLTYCSVTLPYAVFHITVDNEVQHLIQLYSASISIHVVLRSATVEAGNSPALGVTFRQPQFILNVIDLHVGGKKVRFHENSISKFHI